MNSSPSHATGLWSSRDHSITRFTISGFGRRYVIISFLFSEAEARLKDDSERYRFRVRRDLNNIAINKLTPDYESR